MDVQRLIELKVEELDVLLRAHPERRWDVAEEHALRGDPRKFPAIGINRLSGTLPGEFLERKKPLVMGPEERLLDRLAAMAAPLEMMNPIRPRISIDVGTGTMPASFGVELDAELDYTPKGPLPLEEVLARGMPDPECSGFIPQMRMDVEAARELTPEWIKICWPDMQGPFNIAHTILGEQAFVAPMEQPKKFHQIMTMITDFFIALADNMHRWIGPDRLSPLPSVSIRIAECSVNLVSAGFYREHVLPHDRRIAEHFGAVAIHPCSGPHVFRVTLEHLPVVCTEAGFVANSAAGAISVDEALMEIGNRPILLMVGQELPAGNEEEFIRRDLDRCRTNSRMLFMYTGMHWRKTDEEAIRALHRRLDEYWQAHVWGKG
jgi:hypothetical protein